MAGFTDKHGYNKLPRCRPRVGFERSSATKKCLNGLYGRRPVPTQTNTVYRSRFKKEGHATWAACKAVRVKSLSAQRFWRWDKNNVVKSLCLIGPGSFGDLGIAVKAADGPHARAQGNTLTLANR